MGAHKTSVSFQAMSSLDYINILVRTVRTTYPGSAIEDGGRGIESVLRACHRHPREERRERQTLLACSVLGVWRPLNGETEEMRCDAKEGKSP